MDDVLLIDSCVETALVAWYSQRQELWSEWLGPARDSGQQIPPLLAKKIEEHALQLQSLRAIAVTCGPGSYTGMRVGAIFAKSLAFVLNVPLIAVSSLALYAPPSEETEETFAVLLDARGGGIYMGLARRMGNVEITRAASKLVPLEGFLEALGNTKVLVSPHRERIQKRLNPEGIPLRWYEARPSSPLFFQEATLHAAEGKRDGALQLYYGTSPMALLHDRP